MRASIVGVQHDSFLEESYCLIRFLLGVAAKVLKALTQLILGRNPLRQIVGSGSGADENPIPRLRLLLGAEQTLNVHFLSPALKTATAPSRMKGLPGPRGDSHSAISGWPPLFGTLNGGSRSEDSKRQIALSGLEIGLGEVLGWHQM